ncbi:MAG TPA: YhjD/YihY/BrkB family envelope integrity protein [Spirochaetota bacterium]|nr:YhjD/YihY/BrkB family envelope integrity protein [Spirochaetota bacterium]
MTENQKQSGGFLFSIKTKTTTGMNTILKRFRLLYPRESGEHRAPYLVSIIIASFKKFMDDDGMTKSSAIAYTSIVSLVPTLTVILTVYSVFAGVGGQKEVFFNKISLFLLEHNIKVNIDPVFAAISGLIDNAGKIGIIGSVIMIFSATATLRSLEKSLNDIWKIKTHRPIFLKVVYYWAALTLGPILIIAGATAATKVQQVFSSPNYAAVAFSGKDIWVAGSKNTIIKGDPASLEFDELSLDSIDFDNQKIYRFDTASQSLKLREEQTGTIEFKKFKYLDMQFLGEKAWITGDKGILLLSESGGDSWEFRKLGDFSLNDIFMLDGNTGFIAADSGVILNTSDGGRSWQAQSMDGTTANLNAVAFNGSRGVAAGNRGTVLFTENSGASWEVRQVPPARRGNIMSDLNSVFFNGDSVWITGDNGLIVKSDDSGKTWEPRSFMQNSYTSGVFISSQEGFIGGSKGILLHTIDSGENWKKQYLSTDLVSRIFFSGGKLLAAGNNGLIMMSPDRGSTWRGTSGSPFLGMLLNFFAPFLFIWILFLFTYIVIPNTKIPFKYGAIGATFTATIWVIFILFFIVYIRAFATGTFAVYGALVSIPLFLLLVYTSVLIILFGAEVSYTFMHPSLYLPKKNTDMEGPYEIYTGIVLLALLYGKFERGEGPTTFREILKSTGEKTDQADRLVEAFISKNIIRRTEEGTYIPCNASRNIKVIDVVNLLYSSAFTVPPAGKKSGTYKFISGIFTRISAGQKQIIGETTLEEIIALQ